MLIRYLFFSGVTAGGGGWEPLGTPYFDNSTKREATAAVGQPAYLHCKVRNLADRAVRYSTELFYPMIQKHLKKPQEFGSSYCIVAIATTMVITISWNALMPSIR